MVQIDKILSERSDERVLKAVASLSDEEFHKLAERLLGYLELKVTKSRPMGTFYIADCIHKPDGKLYIAFVSRRDEAVSLSDIQSLISYMNRTGAKNGLTLTSSAIVANAADLAEANGIGLADSAKFAALLRRFDMDRDVVKASEVHEARARASVLAPAGAGGQIEEEMAAGYAALSDKDYVRAVSHFDRAILIRDDYDVPWRMKGNALDEMGFHGQAVECYKRALEFYPESDEAWFSLGSSLFALGRYEEEIMCYDRALQYNPRMEKALVNKGTTLHRLGRYEEALAAYDKVLKINYRLEKVHNNRGATLHSMGMHKEALAAYNAAIDLKHDYAEAWMNRGNLLYEMGRTEEALDAFTTMTQIRPELAKGWYLRGLAARRQGNPSLAKASFEQTLRLDIDFAEARQALIEETAKLAEQFTDVPQTVKDIFTAETTKPETAPEEAPEQAPDQPLVEDTVARIGEEEETVEEIAEEVYGDRSELLFLLGRNEEAFDTLGKSLELEGENAPLITSAGNVLYALGRYEAAAKTYEHALAVEPGYVPALLNLHSVLTDAGEDERASKVAEALRKSGHTWQARATAAIDALGKGDLPQALGDIDAALSLEDLSALQNLKGLVKLYAGDYDGGVESFAKCEAMPLDPSEAHDNHGMALFMKGKWEEASLEFDSAIKEQKDNPAAWCNRGCVLYKVGRTREAVACFDEALVIRPSAVALLNKGFTQLSMDQLPEAAQSFRESLKVEETAEAYNDLGIVLKRAGRQEEARDAFKEALRVAPSFKDASSNLRGPEAKTAAGPPAAPTPEPEPPKETVYGERETTRTQLPGFTRDGLKNKTKAELQAICDSLGLPTKGTREELVSRIVSEREKRASQR